MAVNRFSKIVQPLVVDPISFEEFTRVPMMEAQAEAESMAAVNRISTEYNVDNKDLEGVQNALVHSNKSKEDLVTDIANHGVNNETIGKILQTKQERDKIYGEYINQAQRNKQEIDAWRKQVNDMVKSGKIDNPRYGEYILRKEYQKWDGTMDENGSLNNFVPSLGAQYYDVDKDIQTTMGEAAQTLVQGMKYTGAKLKFIGGKPYMQDRDGTSKESNLPGLEAAAKLLLRDYMDPSTPRGDFASYVEMSPNYIYKKIEDYVNVMLDEEVNYRTGSSKFLPESGSDKDTDRKLMQTTPSRKFQVAYNTEVIPGRGNQLLGVVGKASTSYGKNLDDKAWLDKLKYVANPISQAKDIFKSFQEAGEESREEMRTVIKEYSNVTKGLMNRGILDTETYNKALSGDKKATSLVYDAVKDVVETGAGKKGMQVGEYDNISTATVSLDGKATRNNPKKSLEDIYTYLDRVPVHLENTREKASSSEIEDLRKAIKEGNATFEGSIPVGSERVTNEEGAIPGLHQAYVVTDTENGKSYTIGRIWELHQNTILDDREAQEFASNIAANMAAESYGYAIKSGRSAPAQYILDEGKTMNIQIYYDPFEGQRVIQDENGNTLYSETGQPILFKDNVGRINVPIRQ